MHSKGYYGRVKYHVRFLFHFYFIFDASGLRLHSCGTSIGVSRLYLHSTVFSGIFCALRIWTRLVLLEIAGKCRHFFPFTLCFPGDMDTSRRRFEFLRVYREFPHNFRPKTAGTLGLFTTTIVITQWREIGGAQ